MSFAIVQSCAPLRACLEAWLKHAHRAPMIREARATRCTGGFFMQSRGSAHACTKAVLRDIDLRTRTLRHGRAPGTRTDHQTPAEVVPGGNHGHG